jgi:uncharacterized membrane protein
MSTVTQLVAVAIIMLLMDLAWLTYRSAYHRQVFAALQGSPLQIRMPAAVATYTLMIVGVWFFAVRDASSWTEATARGAGVGLLMYGLYDLTNYATLTRYPLHYTLSDMGWGTFLCAVVAAGAFTAAKNIPDLKWG